MTMMPNIDPQLLRMVATAMSTGADTGRSELPFSSTAEAGRYGAVPNPPPPAELWDANEWLMDDWSRFDEAKNVRPDLFPLAEAPDPADVKQAMNLMRALGKSLPRTDPRLIAAKKWFHGTGTKGLTPEAISPFETKSAKNLYGPGFYLTDDSYKVPKGYSKARSGKTGPKGLQDHRSKGAVYEAKATPEMVLDLDEPPSPEIRGIFEDLLIPRDRLTGEPDQFGYVEIEPGGMLEAKLRDKNTPTADFFDAIREDLSDFDTTMETADDIFHNISYKIRQQGYDALTHTGGKRTGNEPHQVLIMLDPNDEFGFGRGQQIQSLSEVPQARYEKDSWPMFQGKRK